MVGAVRQIAVVVAFLGTVLMNTLANTLPLAGRSTGDISAQFPIPFTPAGWVFSIWGLIYLGLAVFVVYQALPAQRGDARLNRVGWLFVVSCAFNVAWLVSWHNVLIGATLVLMLGLFATLVAVYENARLRTGPAGDANGAPADAKRGRAWRWSVTAPFSLYLGWITVATVANVAIFLYDLGWQPGRDASLWWSLLLVVVAAAIGLLVLERRGDAIYGAVLVWAFAGIAAKEWSAPLLATGAVVAASIVALWLVRTVLARRQLLSTGSSNKL